MTDRIRKRLLRWFEKEKRSLPWRGAGDPYSIWVSEVMLQQTTVAAVRVRYERFIRRFPDVVSLSRAREESVLAEWSGLGYYARARNLHRAARRIVSAHGGRLPADPAELEALPGFGKYMAAAIACLAFKTRVPAADTNVRRVVSRIFAIGGNGADSGRAVLEHARELLPLRRPGDGLAALMDLGQLVCTSRSPRCPICPISRYCRARAAGSPEDYPSRRPTRPMETVHVAAALVLRNGRALLFRNRRGPLAGLWTFPSGEAATAIEARRALADLLRRHSIRLTPRSVVARAKHTILRRRLRIEVFSASTRRRGAAGEEVRWLDLPGIERSATATLTRKIARAVRAAAKIEA